MLLLSHMRPWKLPDTHYGHASRLMLDHLFRIYTIMGHLMVFVCLGAKKTFCAPARMPPAAETRLNVLFNVTFESYEAM